MVHCYRVLGIDPDAPQSAIDVKYQNLINMASDLGRFDRDLVDYAYSKLNTPEKRHAYDNDLTRQRLQTQQTDLQNVTENRAHDPTTAPLPNLRVPQGRSIPAQSVLNDIENNRRRRFEEFNTKMDRKRKKLKDRKPAGQPKARGQLLVNVPPDVVKTDEKTEHDEDLGKVKEEESPGIPDDDEDDRAKRRGSERPSTWRQYLRDYESGKGHT